MNKLLSHSYIFRENIVSLIGVCLCLYFSYHAILGSRSVVKHYSLEKQIETLSQENEFLSQAKYSLQEKVEMMRPGAVNKDLLEENVRKTLGYRAPSEFLILSN